MWKKLIKSHIPNDKRSNIKEKEMGLSKIKLQVIGLGKQYFFYQC